MNTQELIEALEIAVSNYDYDGEYDKSAKVSEYIKRLESTKGYLEQQLAKARNEYAMALEEEERTEEAMDSMERKYWEGVVNALEGVLKEANQN